MTLLKDPALEKAYEKDIIVTRVYDFPIIHVWDAWVDPSRLEKWWGPYGFTTKVKKFELRAGGVWEYSMFGPDGTEYPARHIFIKILKPKQIIFSGSALDLKGLPLFEVINNVILTEQSHETSLTLKANVVHATPEATPYLNGQKDGIEQNLSRLADYLSKGE